MFSVLIVIMVLRVHMSKLIKLYALNMCSLWYVNYIVKLFKYMCVDMCVCICITCSLCGIQKLILGTLEATSKK